MSQEEIWAGDFGHEYHARNSGGNGLPVTARSQFWGKLWKHIGPFTSLEIGCGRRHNPSDVGVDINSSAFADIICSATNIPLPDQSFDLVFTCGVLIHIEDGRLPLVLKEMQRLSKKWILVMEYKGDEVLRYRDKALIFKRNYGKELERYAWLSYSGFLGKDEGFDDVTWWLGRRS